MKLSKLFFGVAAAAMFAACSSDDIVEQTPQVNWNEDGTGYMALNITMPQQKATRGLNDVFANGEKEEYKVNDIALLLFDGTKFHSAYVLANTWDNTLSSTNGANITADNKYVTKVEGGNVTDPKAFVVINSNGLFNVEESLHTLTIDGTPVAPGVEFSTIQAMYTAGLDLQASKYHNAADNFLMMNAPLVSKAGGATEMDNTNKIWTLAPVAGAIYPTQAQAAADDATCASVYVERAVAKVTLDAASSVATPAGFSAAIQGWTLDNTNTESYIVRQEQGWDATPGFVTMHTALTTLPGYDATNAWRMAGSASLFHDAGITQGAAGTAAFRTYFAKDRNYETAGTFNSALNDITNAVGTSMYCAENTFDIQNMKYSETTRALLKVKITPADASVAESDGSFYSRRGDDKFYSLAQVKTAAQARAVTELAAYTAYLDGTPSYTVDLKTGTHKVFTVKVSGISVKSGAPADGTRDALVAALTSTSGKDYKVSDLGFLYYTGGIAYYDVRIKHFGDESTPWPAHDAMTIDEAYGTDMTVANNNWLGRWGVLRNNWYNLTVNSIMKLGYCKPGDLDLHPGTPTDPTDPDQPDTPEDPIKPNTPDDNQVSEQWISVDVNILSWAKRFQDVEF